MRKSWKHILVFFLVSFLLHLLWENLQAPLFEGFDSFGQHFPICFYATITGDMLFTVIIYLVIALVHQDQYWVSKLKLYRHQATWILPVVVGVLIAISFELWAIYVAERWTYGSMPIIPILQIGLTPVLQMIFVPLLTIYISYFYIKASKSSQRE